MYKPSFCFTPAGIDACALWRMWMPHLNIANSRFLFTEGIPEIDLISECDIVVVQRLNLEGNVKFLEIIRANGVRIVYDLDDNIWNLPDKNPAKGYFSDDSILTGTEACAEWADAITVSTKELQRVVQKKLGHLRNAATKKPIPIVHIDNCVDLRLFKPPVFPKPEDKIIVGWGGSNTHAGDVEKVWQLLPELLLTYSSVNLEFVGQAPPDWISKWPSRARTRPWCHISEYHNRFATWNWDIVLAPLEEHRFNESKSCIKMIEAGCIGAVCLAQNIAPYQYFCSFNKELEWLLCDLPSDWKRKLDRLITDKPFRRYMGKLMRENVEKNFNIQRTTKQWEQLGFNIMNG